MKKAERRLAKSDYDEFLAREFPDQAPEGALIPAGNEIASDTPAIEPIAPPKAVTKSGGVTFSVTTMLLNLDTNMDASETDSSIARP